MTPEQQKKVAELKRRYGGNQNSLSVGDLFEDKETGKILEVTEAAKWEIRVREVTGPIKHGVEDDNSPFEHKWWVYNNLVTKTRKVQPAYAKLRAACARRVNPETEIGKQLLDKKENTSTGSSPPVNPPDSTQSSSQQVKQP